MKLFASLATAGVLIFSAFSVQAQDLQQELVERIRIKTTGALAMFGMSALPSETASTLLLDTGDPSESSFDFKASQFGAGFTVSEEFPLYLEGFLGWNRYDPSLLVPDGARTSRLPLKWTSLAATGGIGWDFQLTDDLVLRPIAHISLGRIQTDASLLAAVVADRLDLDISFARNGGIWVGGLGASLGLEYGHRWSNDYEVDATLKYTHLYLTPIGGDFDLTADATASTAALWSRLRVPTGLRLFDRPVRGVLELSAAYMPGDQGKVIGSDWLVQAGTGIEIDLSETWVPWVTTTRLMARYTRGERLEGMSVGLGISF